MGGGTFVLNATLIIVETCKRIGLQQVENKKYIYGTKDQNKMQGQLPECIRLSPYFFGEQWGTMSPWKDKIHFLWLTWTADWRQQQCVDELSRTRLLHPSSNISSWNVEKKYYDILYQFLSSLGYLLIGRKNLSQSSLSIAYKLHHRWHTLRDENFFSMILYSW